MYSIRVITDDSFAEFTETLKSGREDYLPMIFGTQRESVNQTDWMDTFNDQYYWLIDDLD